MKKASPDPWLKDLRRMVKREYRAGWIIEEQSEKILQGLEAFTILYYSIRGKVKKVFLLTTGEQ